MLHKIRAIFNKLSLLRKIYPMLENESFKSNISYMLDMPYHISFDHSFIENAVLLEEISKGLTSEEFRLKMENLIGKNENVFIVTDPQKVADIKKVLESEQVYVVTNPDKVRPAWMLENAYNQFFVFEYYDDEHKCWAYNWWTSFPCKLARDAAEHCFLWKEAQEEIEWQLKQILFDPGENKEE